MQNITKPIAFFRGTGLYLLSLLLSCTIAFSAHAESVTLNLNDSEITTLISTVSEITGKNFVIDPRVKGRVTVISQKPMEKNELYQVFLSILDVHGFSAIPSGKIIKVVPKVNAKQSGIPTLRPGSTTRNDQMVTQIIQVENINAQQLVPILRPLIPQEGHLAAYPATNVLIISDRASNVQRLAKIIARIDRVSDSNVVIVPLQHASATEIVRILTSLQDTTDKGKAAQEQVRMAADERANSILLSGEKTARLRMQVLIGHLDTPLESGGNTRVVYLHYAKAKDLVPVLAGITDTIEKSKGKAVKAGSDQISIQSDESSNALVITAPPDVYRSLQSVIKQLDIPRAQVLVEAVIAEITNDKINELGVQWMADTTNAGNDNRGGAAGTNFSSGGAGLIGITQDIKAGNTPPSLPDGLNLLLGRINDADLNFSVFVRALASDADTNILSTPSLVTLDNQQAEIIVGQNVPFITGEFTSTGAAAGSVNPFQTIQRQDIGITLRVTPQINEGNAVKLEIEREVSSLASSAVGASDLITQKRSIKTTVMVEDHKVIVLGGLIDDQLRSTIEKVPLLGDIPLLGRLFRYDVNTNVKRNLMVFLRPVILRNNSTMSQITNQKYNYIRTKQLKIREQIKDSAGATVAPVLPENIEKMTEPEYTESQTKQDPASNTPIWTDASFWDDDEPINQ